ncbi:hypothetical protein PUN28_000196 [Cardiocondyla obscurior]|uniref:Secreted protein n=1 Tax=Cardiocondyla obscurior TaxID=286306 RepID=A0AAW2GY95_9HYME
MLPCRSFCLYIATSLVLFHIAKLKAATNPGNSTDRQYYLIIFDRASSSSYYTTNDTTSDRPRIDWRHFFIPFPTSFRSLSPPRFRHVFFFFFRECIYQIFPSQTNIRRGRFAFGAQTSDL